MTTNLKEACANEGNSESMEDCNMNKMFKAYQDAVGQKLVHLEDMLYMAL